MAPGRLGSRAAGLYSKILTKAKPAKSRLATEQRQAKLSRAVEAAFC